MIIKTCLQCGEGFETYLSKVKKGAKFCCRKCADKAKIGDKNPNFGKHRIQPEKIREKISKALKGVKHYNWKGGIRKSGGRVYVYNPEHPFSVKNYIRRSHFAVEQIIKRYLKRLEEVHHINGIKDDDRPENLMCFVSGAAHIRYHYNPTTVKPEEIIFDGNFARYYQSEGRGCR